MAMTAAAKKKQWDALGLLSTLPELEMYAPVTTHRANVEAGRLSLVAIRVHSTDPIVAFTRTGARRILRDDQAPTEAVLALVRREATDAELDPVAATEPASLRAGAAASTPETSRQFGNGGVRPLLESDCNEPGDPGCSGGGSWTPPTLGLPATTTPQPPGLSVTGFNINDYRESWINGDPELEVWLYGTLQGIYGSATIGGGSYVTYDPNASVKLAIDCAGHSYTADGNWRNFNLDQTGLINPSRPILFAQAAKLQYEDVLSRRESPRFVVMRRNVWLSAPYFIQVIERDDNRGGCPEPPQNRSFSFKFGWVDGKLVLNGFDNSDLQTLFSTPNDPILEVGYPTKELLAAPGWRTLSSQYGSITVTNTGFTAAAIGTGTTFVYQNACVVNLIGSRICP